MNGETQNSDDLEDYTAEEIKNLRCPECGDRVFVSTISPPGWVMCRDMGHWAGPASECKICNSEG